MLEFVLANTKTALNLRQNKLKSHFTKEVNDLQGVTRKQGESFENLMRRFNRKVQQSGSLTEAKKRQYFEKDVSKREARETAIRKRARKENKAKTMLLKGLQ